MLDILRSWLIIQILLNAIFAVVILNYYWWPHG